MSNIFTDSNVSTIANGVAAYSNMNNKGAANKSAKMSNNSSVNDSASTAETSASDTVKKTKVSGKTIGTPELSEKAAKYYETLKKMKSSAVLLNLGRGPIVNDADLVKALNEGVIAAAGLDVITTEPVAKDNPLLTIKDSNKLIVTPHVAWATYEARTRLMDEIYLNILSLIHI